MIVVRAPLRISFMGGGTDLPDFYRTYPGRVISATIDKFVYLVLKPTPLVNKFIVKYQKTESVNHPRELEHNRVRESLLLFDEIKDGFEVGSFADLPAKTGLGSSSSFSVALMWGLHAFLGKHITKAEVAELASRLEIEILKEPIGKQDQYAATFGGINVFTFHPDHTVSVSPVLIDSARIRSFESHLLLFFTGIIRDAGSVLSEQRSGISEHSPVYRRMADSVRDFERLLLLQDFRGVAQMLTEGWKQKRNLASSISTTVLDALFASGIKAGAWGGKLLGAGGGGCFLFVVSPDSRAIVSARLSETAKTHGLTNFQEIPFTFTDGGVEMIFSERPHR